MANLEEIALVSGFSVDLDGPLAESQICGSCSTGGVYFLSNERLMWVPTWEEEGRVEQVSRGRILSLTSSPCGRAFGLHGNTDIQEFIRGEEGERLKIPPKFAPGNPNRIISGGDSIIYMMRQGSENANLTWVDFDRGESREPFNLRKAGVIDPEFVAAIGEFVYILDRKGNDARGSVYAVSGMEEIAELELGDYLGQGARVDLGNSTIAGDGSLYLAMGPFLARLDKGAITHVEDFDPEVDLEDSGVNVRGILPTRGNNVLVYTNDSNEKEGAIYLMDASGDLTEVDRGQTKIRSAARSEGLNHFLFERGQVASYDDKGEFKGENTLSRRSTTRITGARNQFVGYTPQRGRSKPKLTIYHTVSP